LIYLFILNFLPKISCTIKELFLKRNSFCKKKPVDWFKKKLNKSQCDYVTKARKKKFGG
jgi:hypothetical protein